MAIINPNPVGTEPDDATPPNEATDIWDELGTLPRVEPGEDEPDPYPGFPSSDSDVQEASTVEDVRAGTPTDRTEVRVHHVVEELARAGELIRPRLVRVAGNVTPTPLLEYNPNRKRAVVRIVTATQTIALMAGGPSSGGNATAGASGSGSYPMTTGDPPLTIESTAAVVAIGSAPGTACDVAIWEELNSASSGDVGGGGEVLV